MWASSVKRAGNSVRFCFYCFACLKKKKTESNSSKQVPSLFVLRNREPVTVGTAAWGELPPKGLEMYSLLVGTAGCQTTQRTVSILRPGHLDLDASGDGSIPTTNNFACWGLLYSTLLYSSGLDSPLKQLKFPHPPCACLCCCVSHCIAVQQPAVSWSIKPTSKYSS